MSARIAFGAIIAVGLFVAACATETAPPPPAPAVVIAIPPADGVGEYHGAQLDSDGLRTRLPAEN